MEPMSTILPAAADELPNTIFCNCTYDLRCEYRKLVLQCTLAYGRCNGQACLNAVSLQSDPERHSAFDPKILEGL